MLQWTKRMRAGQRGIPDSETLFANLPGWGEAVICPHFHHPGKLFLQCPALGIDMRPLGQLTLEGAIELAEAMMTKTLEWHAAACQNGLAALRSERPTP